MIRFPFPTRKSATAIGLSAMILSGSALIGAVLPAQAADPAADLAGNTIVVTLPNGGGELKMYYAANKTYDGTGPRGAMKGTWEINAKGELCTTQTDPVPSADMPNPRCRPYESHKVGDSWETRNAQGNVMQATLKKGKV